jgi:hypothetical protein
VDLARINATSLPALFVGKSELGHFRQNKGTLDVFVWLNGLGILAGVAECGFCPAI